jgi:hypothetical protein
VIKCSVSCCDRERHTKGMCHVDGDGYRIVRRRGSLAGILEHRLVAEKHLGRALLSTENVHHRNGQRAENTIGPCFLLAGCACPGERHNLELWSTSQPSGQRIADKVQWARELLTTYEAAA